MQNWSILAKFAKKNPGKSAVVYWLFLGELSPRNFPWNRPIFLRICPWKSFENWLFSAKIPRNRPIVPRILTFFPRNRPIFPRICPWKSREILLFFREISEALYRYELSSAIVTVVLHHLHVQNYIAKSFSKNFIVNDPIIWQPLNLLI